MDVVDQKPNPEEYPEPSGSSTTTFAGFEYPNNNNSFLMPNTWLDLCTQIDDLAELKVVLYVIRHTLGAKPPTTAKIFTIDEMMFGCWDASHTQRTDQGTGLTETSVWNGIGRAIRDGYLDNAIHLTYALGSRLRKALDEGA